MGKRTINLKPVFAAKAISKYLGNTNESNHRYRSWEHCYIAFNIAWQNRMEGKIPDYDLLCLHLSCYLSSWGMLRNSFLLERDYKTHLGIVKILFEDPEYERLWCFPINQHDDKQNTQILKDYWNTIKQAWGGFTETYAINGKESANGGKKYITDTLITKILLGTCACIPATDRFYKTGVRFSGGTQYFGLNSYSEIVNYYWTEWESIKEHLENSNLVTHDYPTIPYPPMKVMDMCFWQIGNSIERFDEDKEKGDKFFNLSEGEKYSVLDRLL